jgi:hypothetical protein
MTSPARTRLSPPSWGRPFVHILDRARVEPRRPARSLGHIVNRVAARARRLADAVTPEVLAGLALLVGWTVLWVIFLVGILEPAATLRLVR